jgi:hypothetical protein
MNAPLESIDQAQSLLAQLRAIELWDHHVAGKKILEAYELVGIECRVKRRVEILSKLAKLISQMDDHVLTAPGMPGVETSKAIH